MKTKQIEMSLNDIKEEDQIELSERKEENFKLQRNILELEEVVKNFKIERKKIEYLKDINGNILKYFHIIAPLIEIPLIGLSIISPIFNMTSIVPSLVVLLASIADMFYVDLKYYSQMSDKESFFGRLIDSVKMTTKSERRINKELTRSEIRLSSATTELDELKDKLRKNESKITELEEELAYIEGALIGIVTVIDKYPIAELPENNEVVEYVNKKRTLTKKDA